MYWLDFDVNLGYRKIIVPITAFADELIRGEMCSWIMAALALRFREGIWMDPIAIIQMLCASE